MPLPPPPSPPRSPWQSLYAAGHRARRAYWARRAETLPRPVVSVGNLHWGGSGKTPLTAAVARHLRDRGLRVAILSRGYGSRGKGVRVVSTGRSGEGPLLGPTVAGDEPVLLAGELPGVAVLVCPDRAAAGRHAMEHLDPPPDVFVLDDGFSHVRLARDLDLLAFPASDPFGGGRLAPGGRLREPLASAAAGHAALLTGAPERVEAAADRPKPARELARALERFGFRGRGFAAPIHPLPPHTGTGRPLEEGARVVLVSGVARPDGVRRAAEEVGLRVVAELRFGDHHPYPEASLRRIEGAYREAGASAVATTSKDRVKLHGRLEAPLAEIPVACEPEPAFFAWLDERLGIDPEPPTEEERR